MTNVFRSLVALAFLALASAAPAQTPSAQTPWPDLKDASSYTFASARAALPGGLLAQPANQLAVLSHTQHTSPPYAVSNVRLLYVNFVLAQDGNAPAERCPGNPVTQDFATVFIGGTAYPVTFGGALSASIGDCEFVWSDPLRDASGALVTIPAATSYYVRNSRSIALGQNQVYGSNYVNTALTGGNLNLGDGVEFTATVQSAKRLSGTVAAFMNGSGITPPAMVIGTGWNGSPVFLALGDSICASQVDTDFTGPRGIVGFVGRGLDDGAGSARMNHYNMCQPGTKMQGQSSIATGEFKLRMRVLRSIPNKPFNRIFSEMINNGVYVSYPQWRAAMRDWWQFLTLSFGTMPIYQATAFPHTGSPSPSFWTDLAGQTSCTDVTQPDCVGGTRDQANAYLRAGIGLPANVTVIDTAATAADPAAPQKWRTLSGSWTLDAATAASATSAVLAGASAPANGDWYVAEPGTSNATTAQVWKVMGSGPWTVTFKAGMSKAHAAGVAVVRAPTGDGTHPGSTPHKAAAAAIVARKADRTIR